MIVRGHSRRKLLAQTLTHDVEGGAVFQTKTISGSSRPRFSFTREVVARDRYAQLREVTQVGCSPPCDVNILVDLRERVLNAVTD